MSLSTRLSAIALGLAVIACSSSTAPSAAGIHFVSGSKQTDTIQSVLPQPLVIQLTAPTSVAFQTVTFTAIDSEALVAATAVSTPASKISLTTDANGSAGITVILGKHAGRAGVIVNAPTLNYTLTANFTVNPGAAVAVQALPSDTTIYVGKSVPLRITLVDRFGNARSGGTFQVTDSGPATISGTTATGTAIGNVSLTVASGTYQAFSFISVVPAGRIAAAMPDSNIVLINLDGSQSQILHTPRGVLSMAWNPSGTLLAFTESPPNFAPPPQSTTWPLRTITPSGTITAVDSVLGVEEIVASFSPDGSLIYFNRNGQLWQVHPDGTGNSQYPDPAASGQPSPDGKYVLYFSVANRNVYVLNTSTNVMTNLTTITGLQGLNGAWSPTGDLIAFVSWDHSEEAVGSVHIVAPDGTGLRTLAQGAYFYSGPVSWSPDGNFLIVGYLQSGADIIGVTTPVDLPLAFTYTRSLYNTAWQP